MLDKCLPILPQVDRMAILNANIIDLQWIADRTGGHWIAGHVEGSSKIIKTTKSFALMIHACFFLAYLLKISFF